MKQLDLFDSFQLIQSDFEDAEKELGGFTVDNQEDKEIYNCIYSITQYEDVDGRYFRDCEYSYSMLFGKVDPALYKDYEIVKEILDD